MLFCRAHFWLLEHSPANALASFQALASLAHDFAYVSRLYGKIIVDEMDLPLSKFVHICRA